MPRARPYRAARHALVAALLAAAAIPAPAHAITTTLSSDAVHGAPTNTPIEVVRNGIVIGRGSTNGTGDLNVPGPQCWAGYTPQILPGDVVQVAGGAGDKMTVQDLGIDPVTPPTVTGHAANAPIDFSGLTVTLGGAASGPITGTPAAWATTFPVSATGIAVATLSGGGGTTVVESPAPPAAATDCPPPKPNALANVDRTVVNIANQSTPLTFSGPGTGTLTVGSFSQPVGAPGSAWTQDVPTADLAEGSNVATLDDTSVSVLKDTIMPGLPTSTPPPGRYLTPPAISLAPPESGADVHYTTDGSAPTTASPVYSAPLRVTATQTIRAFAVDPAGNAGPLVALSYQIGPAGGGGGGDVPGVTPPGGGINPGPKPEPPTASIGRVTIAKHVSLRKLRAKGLVTTVVLGQGTTAVRFTVYRRAGKRLRLVASIVRVHGRSGRYRVKLNARALGLTRRGLYRLKFVPGLSRSALDQSAARAVWIRVVG